ncbi:peptide deformylase [Terrarubrum flagellatum]|uniref:peptide deformylase n=1 Tax=Terrirubrum flagellatum TaxID=2895980 RepID=UPI003144F0DB
MAVRSIVKFPDARLRAVASLVTNFGDDLRQLADDLLDTMRAAPGVGVTAPHIGVLQRVVVIELAGFKTPRIYINPEIVWTSSERIEATEGSVSMPGAAEKMERYATIRVRFQGLDGVEREEEASGFHAVCLQHEIDQLDGVFWIQKLSRLKRERLIKRYEKHASGR